MKRFMGILLIGFIGLSCKKPAEETVENIPPDTHIFVEGRTDTVPAYQVIHWYGNDPDGEVVGFYYHWDNDTPSFTTKNVDTFTLSVPDSDSIGVHTLYVAAVDNEGALDPTPAEVTIPVKNSPPTIQFQHGTLPPDTTLPYVTFYVETHDIDGDESVVGFYYRTDYDTVWTFQSIDTDYVTFKNVPEGVHYFCFRAVDKSHAVSDIIADTVYIEGTQGRILVIDDSPDPNADNTYGVFFSDNYSGNYTVWNVRKFLPYSPYDIDGIVNGLGFDVIFWYTGTDVNVMNPLRKAIETYLKEGKSIFLIGPSVLDSVYDPTDTLSSKTFMRYYLGVGDVRQWNTLMLDGGLVTVPQGDTLALSVPTFKLELVAPFDSLDADTFLIAFGSNIQDSAKCAGVKYPSSSPRVYFVPVDLHKFNGNGNLLHVLKDVIDSLLVRR